MSFDIMAKFGMDGSGFAKGLKESERNVASSAERMTSTLQNAFSGNIAGGLFSKLAGGLGLGAATAFAHKLADSVQERFKEISIGSQQLHVDPQTFQRLQNVIEATGGSAEAVAKGFEHIAVAQEKVNEGGEGGDKLLANFHTLGITLEDLRTRSYQEIFFKIAEGMKDAEVTGEKLAAIHELLGKGGGSLIPAFQKGFAGPLANRGVLDEGQLEALKHMKQISAESGAIWKDMANTAGVFFAKIFTGIKLLPSIALFPFLRNRDEGRKLTQEQASVIQRGHAAKEQLAAQRAEKESRKYQADQDNKNREDAQIKDQKLAEIESEHLAEQAAKAEKEAKFDKLSKREKIDYLNQEIAREKQLTDEFTERAKAHPEDATLRVEQFGHQLQRFDAEKRLASLMAHGEENPFRIEDRLARVGGGFTSPDSGMRTLAERTAHATEETARSLKSNPTNPLAGS